MKAVELLGVEPAAAPQSIAEFLELVEPEDRDVVDQSVRDALDTKARRLALEYRVRDTEGDVRWIESLSELRFDRREEVVELIGTLRDVTQRKRQELELTRRGEWLRLVSELASDYVYDSGVDGQDAFPTIVAGSFERTTGYTLEEVQGLRSWLALIHPDDVAELMSERGPIAAKRPFVAEYRIRAKDGSERWLRDHGHPILNPETGALERIVGGVQDITERKALEAQLLQAQKMAALSRLARNVAHDFNNVLMTLRVLLDSLEIALSRDADPSESVQEMHDAMRRGVELTRLLSSFGRVQPAGSRAVDLRSELESAEPMLRDAVGTGMDLEIQLEIEPGEAPPQVMIQPEHFRFALIQLALNAKVATEGVGKVQIRLCVEVVAQDAPKRGPDLPPGPYARVDVTDTGTGIDEADLPRIFEPYFTKAPGAGARLGLAIVYALTTRLQGGVRVRSKLGEGSTFSLLLPLAEAPAQTAK